MLYQSRVLLDTPIAYWPCNEKSGTTLNDMSGNGHSAALSGTVTLGTQGSIKGEPTTAAMYDGSTGKALTTWNPSGYSQCTVEAWVQFLSITNGRVLANSHCDFTGKTGFELYFNSSGPVGWSISIGNGTSVGTVIAGSAVINTSYHVVGVWNGATVSLYVNGVLTGTPATLSGGTLAAGPVNVGMGYNPTYTGDYAHATISHCALYSSALTIDQVNAHYHAGIDGHVLGAPRAFAR
jgi:hypothetical protein